VDWSPVVEAITAATGNTFSLTSYQSVAGGDINDAYVLRDESDCYFVKLNQRTLLPMFESEFEALLLMHESQTIRVPMPICVGEMKSHAFIVMEYVSLISRGSSAQLGEQLAAMHGVTESSFGWYRDNTIGSTPQKNTRSGDWPVFFAEQRLGVQLSLLQQQGMGGYMQDPVRELMQLLPAFFQTYSPVPSMLHGDLWSGNYAFDEAGRPLIFDPAFYYGDRESDLAMTELFAGFEPEFYAAYRQAWPLDEGYAVRKDLYNLYHILNHVNLFGSSYLGQAERMTKGLLAELR
jgi:fructosamine-3-kinase